MFLCAKLVLLDIAGFSLKEASVHTDTDTPVQIRKPTRTGPKSKPTVCFYFVLILRLLFLFLLCLLLLGLRLLTDVQFNHSTAISFELHTYCVCKTCIFQFFSFLSESYSQVTQFPQKLFQVEEIRRNVCNIPKDASPKK